MSKIIEEILFKSTVAINNAINVQKLSEILALYGYTNEKLSEGNELCSKAKVASQGQKKEYGELYAATAFLNQKRKATHKLYMKHLKLARLIFEDELDAAKALMLKGDRKNSISGYLTQTEAFYTNLLANPKWIQQFRQFNVQQEQLLIGPQVVAELRLAYAQQLKQAGKAQKATETRDALIVELKKWYGSFIKLARIALSENVQLLEMLGVKA